MRREQDIRQDLEQQVRPVVKNGVVTLEGEVEWQFQREAALASLVAIDGGVLPRESPLRSVRPPLLYTSRPQNTASSRTKEPARTSPAFLRAHLIA